MHGGEGDLQGNLPRGASTNDEAGRQVSLGKLGEHQFMITWRTYTSTFDSGTCPFAAILLAYLLIDASIRFSV